MSVAGRMRRKNVMGKVVLRGSRTAAAEFSYAWSAMRSRDVYEEFKTWDVGDVIGVEGVLF